MAKNILVFMDGTRNKASEERQQKDTNVWKMYRRFADKDPFTIARYLRGVGTQGTVDGAQIFDDSSTQRLRQISPVSRQKTRSKFVFHDPRWAAMNIGESALGWGVLARVVEAYRYVCQNYESGDRVFLFGFSRGAYQIRTLAGFIGSVGSAFRQQATGPDRSGVIASAYSIYREGTEKSDEKLRSFVAKQLHQPSFHSPEREQPNRTIEIHFVGVWDTVAALGGIGEPRQNERSSLIKLHTLLPGRSLKGVSENVKRLTTTSTAEHMPSNVRHGRHALAAHELRRSFEPLLWSPPFSDQTMKQVWFSGAHADIGGGYPDARLSDIALDWMIQEVQLLGGAAGACPALPKVDPFEIVAKEIPAPQHEIQGWFVLSKPTPRATLQRTRLPKPWILATCSVHESAMHRSIVLLNELKERHPYKGTSPDVCHYPDRVAIALRQISDLIVTFQLATYAQMPSVRTRWELLKKIEELAMAEWLVNRAEADDGRDFDLTLSRAVAMLLVVEHDAPCERLLRWLTGDRDEFSEKEKADFLDTGSPLEELIDDLRTLPDLVPQRRLDTAQRFVATLERALGSKPQGR